MIWIFKHFPVVQKVLLNVPECFASVLKPSTTGILEQKRMIKDQIDEIMKDPASLCGGGHETIYHYFLNPKGREEFYVAPEPGAKATRELVADDRNIKEGLTSENIGIHRLPPLSRAYLLDEGLYMRFAGSDTVGNVCTVALYYILTNPHVHQTLLGELMEIWPDKDLLVGYEKLEKLPYLVSYSLRQFCLSSSRPCRRLLSKKHCEWAMVSFHHFPALSVHRTPKFWE